MLWRTSFVAIQGGPPALRPGRLLGCTLLALAVGCGEDTPSPTASSLQPEAATAAASTALAFEQVSAGQDHTCGVTADHLAYCWGRNSEGELGDGTATSRTAPVAVAGGLRFRQISAGYSSTCAVTTEYRAYCWGENAIGQLGDGSLTRRFTPAAVAGGHRFRQVTIKFQHACGVSYPDNRAYCWGDNRQAQLGIGTNSGPQTGYYGAYSSAPVRVARSLSYHQISAGYDHTCGVTTDSFLFCWGYNRDGQVGDGSTSWIRLKPQLIASTRRFREVDAGRDYSCAVTTGERAFCWGNGDFGKLGNGRVGPSRLPKAVAGGFSFERVTTGAFHACAESTTNRAYCWGSNGNGDLGDGTRTDRYAPVPVSGGLFFSQLSAGGFHTCGRTPAGVAYCWGRGFAGQLGNGSAVSSTTPLAVAGSM